MPELILERFSEQTLAGFFLVLARLTPLFLMAPLFSSRMVPARVRGIVALALAVGLTPVAIGDVRIPMDAWAYGGLVVKELLVGLAYAFALGALFAALSVAGTFIDYVMGLSFGSLVDPVTGTRCWAS
jgi:flagellar biosynthetic protein FliR